MKPLARPLAIASLALVLGACQATGGMSFLLFSGGGTPEEALVQRVRRAEAETHNAQEDYAEAFNLYRRLTSPQAVELEDLSADFEDAVENCEDRAKALAKRLEAVHAEADELFEGWNEELARFSGETLRKKSEAMMLDTQARTQRVIEAIERVQTRMQPVQFKLKDYDLFFHHNLNARAIATLQDTYKAFDAEFRALENEIRKSQNEITAFLKHFEEQQAQADDASK